MNNHNISEAIRQAYKRGENEETMEPIVLHAHHGGPVGRIQNGDQVAFYDIRGEREIELTEAFTNPRFSHFPIKPDLRTDWVTMIEYAKDLPVQVAFPPLGVVENNLCEVGAKHGLKQVKIAETEKAIHVGYFLNGKQDRRYEGEDRIFVPSPEKGGNYESTPKMCAEAVAEKTIACIQDGKYDFITVNFCNVDVLGHTENRESIFQAITTVDEQLGRVVEEAKKNHMVTLITADHGSAEHYLYPDGAIDTGHTDSDVPFMCVCEGAEIQLKETGSLIDVAPTVLHLFDIQQPKEMEGKSLIVNGSFSKQKRRVLLVILDGWGFNPDAYGNLISEANTHVIDSLIRTHPHCILKAAGESVGLPPDTVGNSEAGHLHIGSGRIIPSDKVRIARAIEDGSFFENEPLGHLMDRAIKRNVNLHFIGIVSFFSSHGSVDYALALLKMAKQRGVERVFVHGLLGRRGERPESGAYYVRQIEDECARLGVGQVVSVIGRYWALDREENWDRVEKTVRMLVDGDGVRV